MARAARTRISADDLREHRTAPLQRLLSTTSNARRRYHFGRGGLVVLKISQVGATSSRCQCKHRHKQKFAERQCDPRASTGFRVSPLEMFIVRLFAAARAAVDGLYISVTEVLRVGELRLVGLIWLDRI